jgi:uncharacterized protein YrrD
MRLSKDLLGKPIYSLDQGKLIGNVRDVYFDPELDWLAGIHLGKEGLISRKSLIVPRGAIVVFGVDAVLSEHSDVVTDEKQFPEAQQWIRLGDLQGRGVDTTGGTKVGTIGDAILDESGRISGFSLSRVYVEGPIAESRTIYQEAIVDKGNEDGVMTVDLATVEQQIQDGEPAPAKAEPVEMPEEFSQEEE